MSVPVYPADFSLTCTSIDVEWKHAAFDTFNSLEGAHIWQFHLDEFSPDQRIYLAALLREEETAKAARYHFEVDKNRYTLARGLLRHLLMRYLHLSNQQINFKKEIYGKLYLINDLGIQFNVSYAKEKILLAFSKNFPIGIDVEKINPNYDFFSLVETYFTPNEQAYIGTNTHRFYELWTRKEALLKAFGTGLISKMNSIDVLNGSRTIKGEYPFDIPFNTAVSLSSFIAMQDYYVSLALLDKNMETQFLVKGLSFFDR